MLRLEYFRIPAYSSANAVAFATSFGLFAVFFFTALYLQVDAELLGREDRRGSSCAMALAMVVAGRVSGRWTSARGPRWPMTIGCLLSGGGIVLVDRILAVNVSKLELAAALALVGFGLGLALVAVTSAVLTIVPAERSGMAASTVNTSRELGGVLAVAILGAVINGRLVSELNGKLGGARRRAGAPAARRPRRHPRRPAGGRDARDPHEPGRRRESRRDPEDPRRGRDGVRARAALGPARRRDRSSSRRGRLGRSRVGKVSRRARADQSAAAMRETASSRSAREVPMFSRAKPAPRLAEGRARRSSATLPRSRNASAGSSPSPSSRQSSQAR